MKHNVARLRRRIKNASEVRLSSVVEEYKQAKEDYKEAIQVAITTGWKKQCSAQKNEDVWRKAYRIIKSCSPRHKEVLLKCAGDGRTLTPNETVSLLADTFYPADEPVSDTTEQRNIRMEVESHRRALLEELPQVFLDFTYCEVKSVFRHMDPKKAPGEDGLTSDICHEAFCVVPDVLLCLLNKCLYMGYFPLKWKKAMIKVIPKAGKDLTNPRSLRPIGLLSVFAKLLEKLFTNRLQWQLGHESKLSLKQYGFTPMISTEDALNSALEVIREALLGKKLVVVISLDIEGAFDSAWWPAILDQLRIKDVDPSILRLIYSYLENRSVTIRYAGAVVTRSTSKGCIQGSTSGPLLWNVQLDPLLQETYPQGVSIQAFADDILIIAQAQAAEDLEEAVNQTLEIIVRWGNRHKLRFSTEKTKAMIVTRRVRYDRPIIRMEQVVIPYSDHIKVLGLVIDARLNFRRHLDYVYEKACNLYKLVSRGAGAQWGLNSEIVRTIYIAVIEPTVLYAASAWACISAKRYAERKLNQITRQFAIMIAKAHRTTSLVASLALARILPLTLRVAEHRDLYMVKRGRSLPQVPGYELEKRVSQFCLPHPALRKTIPFGYIREEADLIDIGNLYPIIYTDGSKIEGRVGGAISLWQHGIERLEDGFSLMSHCSVYQAELCAIVRALEVVEMNGQYDGASIVSDSRSALESLADTEALHPLVNKARMMIQMLEDRGSQLHFYWVRAHVGIRGNERADELAKSAALCPSEGVPVYRDYPLSFAKHLIRDSTVNVWQRQYQEASAGVTTKMFFPSIRRSYKILATLRLNNLRAQMLTGHGGFRSYLFKYRLAVSPACVCDGETFETVEHVIVECPRFSRLRHDCEILIGFVLDYNTLAKAISDDNCRGPFLAFAERVVRSAAKANGSTVASGGGYDSV